MLSPCAYVWIREFDTNRAPDALLSQSVIIIEAKLSFLVLHYTNILIIKKQPKTIFKTKSILGVVEVVVG